MARRPPAPYRRDAVEQSSGTVWVAASESDADALLELELPATAALGWSGEQLGLLAQRDCVVLLYGDAEQQSAAHQLARELHAQAGKGVVRLTGLPALGEGEDLAGWIDYHSRADLLQLGSWAPPYVPTSPNGNGYGPHGAEPLPEFTDTQNALRFVKHHGERFRYDHTRGLWRMWDGKRWVLDRTQRHIMAAKDIVLNHLPSELEHYCEDHVVHPETRKRLLRDILACESTGRIFSLPRNAESSLEADHETWDADPYLLNCANGIVDLRSGELRPHDPAQYLAKLAPGQYRLEAEAPIWHAFLERIFDGDAGLISFVQRAVGLSLIGTVLEHVLFICWGQGANGKSTLVSALQYVLGEYAWTADAALLLDTKAVNHPTNVAELTGRRFVLAVEPEGRLNESMVKLLTGGDERRARFMFQDAFTYMPSDTFWLMSNHKPMVAKNAEGIWRRLLLVPFTVAIPEPEQDRFLGEKLRAEADGILAWAIAGCLEYQRMGLKPPAIVRAATAQYRSEMDSLAEFLSDCTVADLPASVPASELHKAYVDWAEAQGERPASQRFLGLRLGERGYQRAQMGKQRRWHWVGLRLRRDDDLFPDDTPDLGGRQTGEPPNASSPEGYSQRESLLGGPMAMGLPLGPPPVHPESSTLATGSLSHEPMNPYIPIPIREEEENKEVQGNLERRDMKTGPQGFIGPYGSAPERAALQAELDDYSTTPQPEQFGSALRAYEDAVGAYWKRKGELADQIAELDRMAKEGGASG